MPIFEPDVQPSTLKLKFHLIYFMLDQITSKDVLANHRHAIISEGISYCLKKSLVVAGEVA